MKPPATPVGEALVARGLLTTRDLQRILEMHRSNGEPVEDIVLRLGFVSQRQLQAILGGKAANGTMELDGLTLEPAAVRRVPVELARRHRVVPVRVADGTLTVAMANVTDLIALEELRYVTGLEIERVAASPAAIERAIADHYTVQDSVAQAVREIGLADDTQARSLAEAVSTAAPREPDPSEQAPGIRLANLLLAHAVNEGASDVHLEPEDAAFRVRFRVSGVLREAASPPHALMPAIISRLKVMAGMDVSERRLPQDGRFTHLVGSEPVDFRASTLPTIFGEKMVLRVLNRGAMSVGLHELGVDAALLADLRAALGRTEGLILVTGPTGSGKTTSLYAMLREIKGTGVNVVTVEDPVEYHLPLVSQVQTNEKAGLTFANTLRSILRQDPDVIMVGEIRDLETAELAVRSAMTGHLVLSTLHANDACATVARLLDMGVEPYLAAASLVTVVAQRLVRRVCGLCAEPVSPAETLVRQLGLEGSGIGFRRGAGCRACRQTGFTGRTGIFEVLTVSEEIRDLIARRAPVTALAAAARIGGMRTLREDGLAKIAEGVTTVEEVLRVAPVEAESTGNPDPPAQTTGATAAKDALLMEPAAAACGVA